MDEHLHHLHHPNDFSYCIYLRALQFYFHFIVSVSDIYCIIKAEVIIFTIKLFSLCFSFLKGVCAVKTGSILRYLIYLRIFIENEMTLQITTRMETLTFFSNVNGQCLMREWL